MERRGQKQDTNGIERLFKVLATENNVKIFVRESE